MSSYLIAEHIITDPTKFEEYRRRALAQLGGPPLLRPTHWLRTGDSVSGWACSHCI